MIGGKALSKSGCAEFSFADRIVIAEAFVGFISAARMAVGSGMEPTLGFLVSDSNAKDGGVGDESVLDLKELVSALGPVASAGGNGNTSIVDNLDGSFTLQVYDAPPEEGGNLRTVVTLTIWDTGDTSAS